MTFVSMSGRRKRNRKGGVKIAAGIIAAVVFVIALSRSAGLSDRKMEEIYKLYAAREEGGVDGIIAA